MKAIYLLEVDGIRGLTVVDLFRFLSLIGEDEVYPIEIEASEVESSAMGFITAEAADSLEYDYTELSKHIASIMDDMNNETKDGRYKILGIDVYLTRNLPDSFDDTIKCLHVAVDAL